MVETFLEPTDSKHRASVFVVLVVFRDARRAPRVERIMEKYAKIKQRFYFAVDDRYGTPIDRVAVYMLESVESDRAIKSTLRNIEATGDIELVIIKC